jgi:peptide subunit release factor 1 (eRF1)
MAENTLTRDRLRALAELRPDRGRVLSVFLNLDPSEFANAPARTTAINSVVNQAGREVEDADGLEHDERQALREDVERVREVLSSGDIAQNGTRGVAVYACKPADVLEVVRLAHTVQNRVVLDRGAYVEPLVEEIRVGRWAVLLCNRRAARIFIGPPEELEETDRIEDDVHQQHDQGGWSQSRYQRSVEKEALDHVRHAADELFKKFQRRPFDGVLLGAPEEKLSDLKAALHPYLQERVRGSVHVDIENTNADGVRRAAAEAIEQWVSQHEREVLDRLEEHIGREARGAAGLDGVIDALNQARVEILLVGDGFRAPGARDHESGLLGTQPGPSPLGGTFEPVADVVEEAMEKALEQNAEVMVVRRHDTLSKHGGIAALLRF